MGAHLEYANLTGTHLNEADLSDAHLNKTDLTGAHLGGADLEHADLTGAYLDFDPESLPKVFPGISTAQNLYLVKFYNQPAGLVKLRKEFKDLGLRLQENQLTYAIKRSELNRRELGYGRFNGPYIHSWAERAFNTIFFDWTCQYGMSPAVRS